MPCGIRPQYETANPRPRAHARINAACDSRSAGASATNPSSRCRAPRLPATTKVARLSEPLTGPVWPNSDPAVRTPPALAGPDRRRADAWPAVPPGRYRPRTAAAANPRTAGPPATAPPRGPGCPPTGSKMSLLAAAGCGRTGRRSPLPSTTRGRYSYLAANSIDKRSQTVSFSMWTAISIASSTRSWTRSPTQARSRLMAPRRWERPRPRAGAPHRRSHWTTPRSGH